MRIAVVNLTAGGMSGGYRKYLTQVIPRISAQREVERVLCISPSSLDIDQWFSRTPNIDFEGTGPLTVTSGRLTKELDSILDRFAPDVLFIPVERYFRFRNVPVVNMLQNMEPLVCPYRDNPFTEKLKNRLRLRDARRALTETDRIVAISEFVKDFLVRRWGIPERKIGTVYHGNSNTRVCMKDTASVHGLEGVSGKFIFTAGSIRPARGLKDLLLALGWLKERRHQVPPVVIAGAADAAMLSHQEDIKKLAKDLGLHNHVIWAGQLNEKEMTWCYHNCAAFVMTSRVESFGQIGLEAMSCGCLCISANNPCLPEIFGNSVLYYDSGSGEALGEALATLFSWDQSEKRKFSLRALERASKFSWDVCAEKTVEELAKAIEQSRLP